jgi:hypothetical protein
MEKVESNEFEYYASDDDYPLIPGAEYWAECIDAKKQDYFVKGQVKKKKLYLCFHIIMLSMISPISYNQLN